MNKEFQKEAAEFELIMNGNQPEACDVDLRRWKPTDKPIATRAAGGEGINTLAKRIPNLGGEWSYAWRNMAFGVREPDADQTEARRSGEASIPGFIAQGR